MTAAIARSWPELAKILGFTRTSIQGWRKLDGAPSSKDVAEWQAFVDENDLGVAGNKAPASTTALRDEKLRADIKLKNLQIAEKERKLVPLDEVDRLLFTVGTRQKQHLYAVLTGELPTQLAGLDAGSVRQSLQQVADEICDAMRANVEQWRGCNGNPVAP